MVAGHWLGLLILAVPCISVALAAELDTLVIDQNGYLSTEELQLSPDFEFDSLDTDSDRWISESGFIERVGNGTET